MSLSLTQAIKLAATLHAGQLDKAGNPYILHVLRVMLAVEAMGERFAVAAVLHDVVEDTGFPLLYLRPRFGQEIMDAVDALSRREGEDYGSFIERVKQNEIALQVKLADIADNSLPERMGRLPLETQHRLIAKYHKAFNVLMGVKP